MKKITGIAAAAALSALPWMASAQGLISYDYAQLDIIVDGEVEFDGAFSEDLDGFALEVSALVHPNVFLMGQATQGEISDSGLDFTAPQFSFGVGGRLGLMESSASALDAYGSLNYETLGIEGISFSGWGLTAGLRWAPTAQFEINPSIAYVDYGSVDDFGSKISIDGLRYQLRGLFHVNDQVAISLDFRFEKLEIDDGGASIDFDIDQIRLGARWKF
ncbi:MAG: hypothetical protein C0462_11050 [Alcanivorax sp.]|nr:hypothetical protein [Alcanivorax sp.]